MSDKKYLAPNTSYIYMKIFLKKTCEVILVQNTEETSEFYQDWLQTWNLHFQKFNQK